MHGRRTRPAGNRRIRQKIVNRDRGCGGLIIETTRSKDSLIVRLAGELDVRTAPVFRARVQQELEEGPRLRHLILDLRGVTFIDSSGVGALLGRCRDIRTTRAGRVVVFGLRPNVLRVLQFAGLLRVLAVAETKQQALALVREGETW
nr:anti-sigma F factor antagonist [Bacillota bacterium]